MKQAWHSHTVSIQMSQHNSGMWLAALSLMAGVQLVVYAWWVSLNQIQTRHPTICQVPLSFLIVMITTRAGKRRLLIEQKHFPYVCPLIETNEVHVWCLGMSVPLGQAKQAMLVRWNPKIYINLNMPKKQASLYFQSILSHPDSYVPCLHTSCKLLSSGGCR